jgi:hypothetical protein
MKRSGFVAALATIFLLCVAQRSHAGSEDCQDAISQYNSAVSDISAALRRYTSCLSDSNGHDDCSTEFHRIRSAQDDFESAVSKYGMECD